MHCSTGTGTSNANIFLQRPNKIGIACFRRYSVEFTPGSQVQSTFAVICAENELLFSDFIFSPLWPLRLSIHMRSTLCAVCLRYSAKIPAVCWKHFEFLRHFPHISLTTHYITRNYYHLKRGVQNSKFSTHLIFRNTLTLWRIYVKPRISLQSPLQKMQLNKCTIHEL